MTRMGWVISMLVMGVALAPGRMGAAEQVGARFASADEGGAVKAEPAVKQAAAPGAKTRKPAAETPLALRRVVLRVNHRVFANFAQLDTVALDEEFPVGDSDLSARILRFVPDFSIERDHKIVSRSQKPKNPAVQIEVNEAGAPHDTSWAFLNFPPHFSAKSVLAFQILRLEFENHDPVVNQKLIDREAAGGKEP